MLIELAELWEKDRKMKISDNPHEHGVDSKRNKRHERQEEQSQKQRKPTPTLAIGKVSQS